MRVARSLVLVALLPLFAACQLFDTDRQSASHTGQTRMQGQLTAVDGQLMFQPCNQPARYTVNDSGGTSVLQEAATLADAKGNLFADVRGRLVEGRLDLEKLYRVERSGTACNDPDFKLLILRAAGHKPEWSVKVSGKGMIIERAGQKPLALPYVEEQLGDGRFNLSSEANNQRIELWVAPQRCVDSNGSIQHMTAELRIDGQVQRGCGHFGGARDD
ncbi:COG3650 family protein [Pseudomonas sp. PDM31]|uniref:COG3650 family protein n=1 Tax=Pseudomonas sp. PDM31 TaxID=2854778 RepID=UPI001C466DC2|nr:hypothetical protein [Pseudomonas sp. PDM31]MBV7478923.1 hypothetical protein [Pseudomonas sp. PDM31]